MTWSSAAGCARTESTLTSSRAVSGCIATLPSIRTTISKVASYAYEAFVTTTCSIGRDLTGARRACSKRALASSLAMRRRAAIVARCRAATSKRTTRASNALCASAGSIGRDFVYTRGACSECRLTSGSAVTRGAATEA